MSHVCFLIKTAHEETEAVHLLLFFSFAMPKTKAFSKTKGGAGADDFKKKRVKLGKRVAKATATDTKYAARADKYLNRLSST